MQKLQLVPLSRPIACARHRSEICHQITQATLVCYLLVNNISIQSWQITEDWVATILYFMVNSALLWHWRMVIYFRDRAFVIRVTKLLIFFGFRALESAPSVRLFLCFYVRKLSNTV